MPRTITHITLSRYARDHMTPLPDTVTRTLVQASDPLMELPTQTMLREIVESVKPDMPHADDYTENGKFDCDDFAYAFKGLATRWYQENRPALLPMAIGVSWGQFQFFGDGQYHALNWVFLADDQKLYWIEPQFLRSKPFEDSLARFSKSRDRVNLLIV